MVVTARACRGLPAIGWLLSRAIALSVGRPIRQVLPAGLRWRFYLLPALLAISACTHVPVAVCPPLKERTPEFSQRLADELEPLPEDSAIIDAISELISLRDAIKECRK